MDGVLYVLCNRKPVSPDRLKWEDPSDQLGEGAHLFSGVGFLDGSWFHRAYWLYGKHVMSGCNYWFRASRHAPAGRLLVFDEETVYGHGRQPHYFLWTPSFDRPRTAGFRFGYFLTAGPDSLSG